LVFRFRCFPSIAVCPPAPAAVNERVGLRWSGRCLVIYAFIILILLFWSCRRLPWWYLAGTIFDMFFLTLRVARVREVWVFLV